MGLNLAQIVDNIGIVVGVYKMHPADKTILELEKFFTELKKDPERLKQFLIDTGIYDKNLNLTKNYTKGV